MMHVPYPNLSIMDNRCNITGMAQRIDQSACTVRLVRFGFDLLDHMAKRSRLRQ